MRVDSGRRASIPNSLVIGALVVNTSRQLTRQARVRMSLALTTSAGQLEAFLPEIAEKLGPKSFSAPTPSLEVADIGETS